jgi:hypothetical protein
MAERLVVILSGTGENDAIGGLMSEYGNALTSMGLPVVNVTFEPSELQFAVDRMVAGEVRFGLTWLGIGQDLGVQTAAGQRTNLWETTRTPLLKIHGDTPAYFSDRHHDVPNTSVNLYMGSEFARFRRRWMPQAKTLAAVVPPWPMASVDRSRIDVSARRKGTLVFLKNGNAPAALRQLWRERLGSSSLLGYLEALAEQVSPLSLQARVLHIGDVVGEFLSGRGIDPDTAQPLITFLTAQLDDYTRRVKSELVAKSILDFPVIVRGSRWAHVDFSGRRAKLLPGLGFRESSGVYASELGVIDMAANMHTEPHERVQRAAGAYALVVTNRQRWLEDDFPEFRELAFDFDAASIAAKVADVLDNREKYVEMGLAFGERFRQVHPTEEFVRRVVELADIAAVKYASEKPQLQDYFGWPSL